MSHSVNSFSKDQRQLEGLQMPPDLPPRNLPSGMSSLGDGPGNESSDEGEDFVVINAENEDSDDDQDQIENTGYTLLVQDQDETCFVSADVDESDNHSLAPGADSGASPTGGDGVCKSESQTETEESSCHDSTSAERDNRKSHSHSGQRLSQVKRLNL